jgi:uncharacterized protein YaaN involved in tellurite resistance
MRQLKRTSMEEIYNLQTKIAFGNKLKELFEVEIAKPENEFRKAYLGTGLRKVMVRIQSMTEMILLYNQAIAATDIINDNNDKLIDSVNNAIDKTSNLITVSAMIAMSLADQENVINAVEATNKTIEDQFKENARLLAYNYREDHGAALQAVHVTRSCESGNRRSAQCPGYLGAVQPADYRELPGLYVQNDDHQHPAEQPARA